ncbi:3-oxoacyl-[acyl-carrier-protein] synthase III C-terminal domain-containing protein [Kitasatospora sp. NPDC051853]|uniref:3-oxoacyl-[acyl-carrier-protein] synthase III C-terminal domain-containing protein n=1 Tax=Kitasatospora sp. NPDC051853 TaxID=3364058 RepID=UPI00378F26C6
MGTGYSTSDSAARVHRPVFRAAPHVASIDEVVKLAGGAYAGGVLPDRVERMMRATGVRTRSFVRPPEELFDLGAGPEFWDRTADLLAGLAAEAATRALAAAALAPDEVDALVVTSVTGWTMPNLDVRLIRMLGLPATVRRVPVSTIGCAGGLYGLIRAREQVAAHPGSRVLVVAAEAFSTSFQPDDTSIPGMIYKALGGDGAAATVVTGADDPRPGTAVELSAPLELLIPDTEDNYRLTADHRSGHIGFTSTSRAPLAVLKAQPQLDAWRAGLPGDPAFHVVHHGGPAILDRTAQVLGCEREHLRHSWDSLHEHGNMSSVSVLDVLARTLDEPDGPQPGEEGVMLTIGPGVTIVAARLRRAPAA